MKITEENIKKIVGKKNKPAAIRAALNKKTYPI